MRPHARSMTALIASSLALVVALVVALLATPGHASAEPGAFAGERADTVADGRVELGVLEPTRWGLTPNIELATHPIFFFAVPHVAAKVAWNDSDVWRISTRHELSYPSFGLGLVSAEGAGGLLPANQDVPELVVLDNEVIMTMTLPLTRRFVTAAVGFEVAPRFSGPEVIIEAPYFFPRTAAYTSGIVGHGRFTFSGDIAWGLTFEATVAGYYLPKVDGFAVEQEGWLGYRSGERWKVRLGLLNSTAWYPYGVREHRFPLADFLFAF